MNSIHRFLLAAVALLAIAFTAGCSNLPRKLEKLDALGIRELHIPGRYTTTRYTTEDKDGKRLSTLRHSNPLLSEPAVVVRERPIPAAEPSK